MTAGRAGSGGNLRVDRVGADGNVKCSMPSTTPNSNFALDPTLAAALALHTTRGGYALLLGSGISRAAGIPTGWEVMLDLIGRIAALEGVDALAAADPVVWYQNRFGDAPGYSRLLQQLARTATERRELLRQYFEPTAEERTSGQKVPTRAHHAVAHLVRDGVIHVLLTTNFDQLLETALREAGVVPAVVSTPDQIRGMMPLHLERATVIKLHGDYLDTRIKNTPDELESYDAATNALLDRVLDDYGLVVCGWSASWDTALRDAILRAPNRRFTTFWAAHGEMSPEATQVVEARHAQVIPITSADDFLDALVQKVTAVESLGRPHPLSTAALVATMKRYLPVPSERIRLHDLVMGEVDAAVARIRTIIPTGEQPSPEALLRVMTLLEGATERLIHLFMTGAEWGDAADRSLWYRALERLAAAQPQLGAGVRSSYEAWDNLWRYPAQLVFYAMGLGYLARERGGGDALLDLLLTPELRFGVRGAAKSPAVALNFDEAVDHRTAKMLPGYERRFTPMSDWLHDRLAPVLAPLFSTEAVYSNAFDRFEYLVALVFGDQRRKPSLLGFWAPVGRLAWRLHRGTDDVPVLDDIGAEIARDGSQWPLLQRGLFDGSPDTLNSVREQIMGIMQQRAY